MRIIPFIVDASCWTGIAWLFFMTGWIVAAAVVGSLGIVYIYNAVKTLKMEYNLRQEYFGMLADQEVRMDNSVKRSAINLKERFDRGDK